MSWIRKSPFADGVDPTAHMVALISAEAERTGTTLSETEKQILLRSWDPETVLPEEFRSKAKRLIEQTFDYEADPDNPINLGNSVEWADWNYPTIVALAEEVMLERQEKFPRLRGRRKIIDLFQLVGCGVVVVILMMLVVAVFSSLFGSK
jgi:hypothetical protein